MDLSRRSFIKGSAGVALGATALGGALAACSSSGSGGKGEVVVLSWESYVPKEVIEGFQNATGITMKGIPAESDQDMFAKIKAGGGSQYDVVFCNCGWAPTYYKNGLTDVIDLSEIPSAKDLYPAFTQDTALPYVVSPGKTLLYPNQWAALSLAWNVDVPFQPGTPLSWNAFWQAPKNKVLLQGGHDDFIALAGLANGVPRDTIYSMDGATLQAASDKLKALKPFQLNSQNSDDMTAQRLATGEAYLGFAPSLGVAFRSNSRFADNKPVVKAQVPQEGTLGWIDGPQLVKGAKNRDNALAFMNYFGGNADIQKFLWTQSYFAQCSQVSTERTIAGGGQDADTAKALGADHPELAKQIVFQAQPDHADAWAAAYDQAMA